MNDEGANGRDDPVLQRERGWQRRERTSAWLLVRTGIPALERIYGHGGKRRRYQELINGELSPRQLLLVVVAGCWKLLKNVALDVTGTRELRSFNTN